SVLLFRFPTVPDIATLSLHDALPIYLSAQGFMVVQSTSPMFARDSFWCIAETLKQAGLQTYPYHVYVPSFGGRLASVFRRCTRRDRKSTRLNSSHVAISYAVFCLKKK